MKTPRKNFIVVSYCDDQQQKHLDLVRAIDKDRAQAYIGKLRDYAVPIETLVEEDLEMLLRAVRQKKAAVLKGMKDLKKNHRA